MGSINAQRVAQKVVEKVRSNELVNLGDIIEEVGYSKAVSIAPTKVTKTKSYQRSLVIESRPLLEQMEEEKQRIMEAIRGKDITKEEYRILVASLDVMNKNTHLLSGGTLSTNIFVLPSEVIQKNAIDVKPVDNK